VCSFSCTNDAINHVLNKEEEEEEEEEEHIARRKWKV